MLTVVIVHGQDQDNQSEEAQQYRKAVELTRTEGATVLRVADALTALFNLFPAQAKYVAANAFADEYGLCPNCGEPFGQPGMERIGYTASDSEGHWYTEERCPRCADQAALR